MATGIVATSMAVGVATIRQSVEVDWMGEAEGEDEDGGDLADDWLSFDSCWISGDQVQECIPQPVLVYMYE